MPVKKHKARKIYIVAGEASGDLLGSKLIRSLKKLNKTLEFRGVGGEKMKAEGLTSIFKISDLSIMGFIEVLPSIPRILARLNKTVSDIVEYKPDVVVTIDSPGFNFRLASKLRKQFGKSIKIIHYVAPSVWAYKPERVHIVKALFDHLILILPFEKKYFDEVGMQCTYVGHPILEDSPASSKKNSKLITMMPGSRISEVRRHLPIFLAALDIVQREIQDLQVFIPTVENVKKYITAAVKQYPNIIVSDNPKEKEKYLSASVMAVVKSGTSSMEMVHNNIPAVVAYKINSLSALYIKSKLKIKFASLINILLNREVIKEFLQEKLTPKPLAYEILRLIKDRVYRSKQLEDYEKGRNLMIDLSKPSPSDMAASIIHSTAQTS